MEAVAIQVNQTGAETETKDAKTQKPKTGNSGGTFLSLLKNLTSAVEREQMLLPSAKKSARVEVSKTGDKNANKIPSEKKPLNSQKKQRLSKQGKGKDAPVDLHVQFDEEINPRKLLADAENEKIGVQIPQLFVKEAPNQESGVLNEKAAVISDADNQKTLLQVLMQGDIGKLSEDDLKHLLENAEKTEKAEKPGAKRRFSVADFKKQAENDTSNRSGNGENQNAKQAVTKKITVEDFRTAKKIPQDSQAEPVTADIGTHTTNGERVATETENTAQVDVMINLAPEKNAELSAKTEQASAKPAETQNFSQALAEQLFRANDDIVQAGKVILRNNSEGTIRLHLQPAHLGKINILLEMHEGKKLSGKISVQSKEALSAFQENLGELIASFEENGFEMSGFELSWSGQGENGERFAQNGQRLFGSSKSYEDDLSLRSNENLAEKIIGFGETKAVNVLA